MAEAPLLYQAGEIVPQCSGTLDVYVKDARDVRIGDNSPQAREGRLVGMIVTDDGLVQMRLALVAGDRLKVRPNLEALSRYRSGAYGAMVQSDEGAYVRWDDVLALLHGGAR